MEGSTAAPGAGPAGLVASSDHLVQALQSIEAASRDFNSPDPAARKRGEATFLSLRDSDAALEYACFALQHTQDSFVLFQMLGLILQQLPTLSGGGGGAAEEQERNVVSAAIPSLRHLRDFLLYFVVSRGEAAEFGQLAQSGTAEPLRQWPQYVRTRAYQLIAAVSKRMLGTALGSAPEHACPEIMRDQLGALKNHIVGLIQLPGEWPMGTPQSTASGFIRAISGLGIFRACLDEFVLTPAGAGAGSGDELTSLGMTRGGSGSMSDPSSSRGSGTASKAKQKDSGSSVGLTGREHLLCKLAAQDELLPELLSTVLHLLVNELQRPSDQQQQLYPHLLFFQLVSTLEKLLSWSFVLISPFGTATRSGDVSSQVNARSEEDDGFDLDAFSAPGGTGPREIPPPISSVLLSQDLLRLLSASYDAAQTTRCADAIAAVVSRTSGTNMRAAIDAGREASTALHRLRTCVLMAARFEARSVLSQGGAGEASGLATSKSVGRTQHDWELQRQHTEGMLELIAGLVQALATGVDGSAKTPSTPLESMHRGQGLLFVVQLLGNFASVVEAEPDRLAISLGIAGTAPDVAPPLALSHFLDICSRLAAIVYDFAFSKIQTSGDMDGDELSDLAELCVDQLVNSWSILARALKLAVPSSHLHLVEAYSTSVRDDVLRRYIRGRLQAARGSSDSGLDMGDDDVDVETEIGSAAEKDRERFADQLRTLAELARLSPAILGPILMEMCEMAEDVSRVLIGAVQSGSSRPTDARSMRDLEARWEETHWLLLIAGYILADDIAGELPAIPETVEQLGSEQSPTEGHPAVRIIKQLSLTLFESLSSKLAVSNELSSPQVMETALWFINRWSASYLLPLADETGEGQPSSNAALNAAFGGSNRTQIIAFLGQQAAETIKLWLAEADVLRQTAAFISGFSRCQHAAAQLVALPAFVDVVSAVLSSLDMLPVDTHGSFISAVVGTTHTASRWARSASDNPSSAQQAKYIDERTELYTTTITQTLEQRLSSAVLRHDFEAVAQNPTVIQAVQTALDMLEGLALTIQLNPAAGIYNFIARFFPALIRIVDVYSERSEITVLVLKVFRTLSISTAWAISEDDSAQKQLNEAVWALFGAIDRKRNIIGSTEFGAADDDNPYEALCLALETLYGVLELTDTGNVTDTPGSDRIFSALSALHAEDVAMYGFSVLFPSLTADSFSDPRVREKLSRVTCTVWLHFPARVFAVARAEAKPGQLANGLIEVLVRLLSADESQHVSEALWPIGPLARAVRKLARDDRAKLLCNEILPNALDQLIFALLRLVLLEPSEEIDGQITALRPLLIARASPAFGDQEALSSVLQTYCATAPLHSLREHASTRPGGLSAGLDGPPTLSPAEERRRRELFQGTVGSIASVCFASIRPGVDDLDRPRPQNVKEAIMQQKEERKAEALFCRTVKSYGLLQARRALRIR
ncbi:hypothetical protein OC835_004193 [Tilletia horrida]|uniref:Exportin-4 n=1 Tax=Tilletia horrida TaxID=155126 RepID=A0AAN6JL13_9BASI|nr:hypothetical protein OC835_004193 [Tilletia horrida]KAK0534812.1 hypothetical protein OC842_002525 [Tilletia horrida]